MKKYEDPEMNVVLFNDKVFAANIQGESGVDIGGEYHDTESGGLGDGELIS